jgi:hypothetical protein
MITQPMKTSEDLEGNAPRGPLIMFGHLPECFPKLQTVKRSLILLEH